MQELYCVLNIKIKNSLAPGNEEEVVKAPPRLKKKICKNVPICFPAGWERTATGLLSHTAGIGPPGCSSMRKAQDRPFNTFGSPLQEQPSLA